MKRRYEDLAALAAGRELSDSQRRQWETVSETEGEARRLAGVLARQREALLLLRDDASSQGDGMRAQVRLREAIRKEQRRFGVWRPRWALAGGIAVTVLATAGVWAVWSQAEPVAIPVAVGTHPELPQHWAMAKRQAARTPAVDAPAMRTRKRVIARVAKQDDTGDSDSPSHAMPVRTVGVNVTEILEQADGSTRLRLQTRNPAVVIYLVEGKPQQTESGGE